MIIFSALVPHPPIIIPEVGKKQTKKVKSTISALKKLADGLEKSDPSTIIIISPHSLAYPDRFNINMMPKLKGDFSQFGDNNTELSFANNSDIANKIITKSEKHGINTLAYDNNQPTAVLDHGALVPLYYLAKNLGKVEIVNISISSLDKNMHFAFGEIIGEVAHKSKEHVAVIASGDLSHRLIQESPAGYSKAGKEFDKLLLDYLKNKDVQGILEMDEDFIEEAGECGYRSLLILLGTISKQNSKTEVLSYEGPFGVGYAVVNFRIKSSS